MKPIQLDDGKLTFTFPQGEGVEPLVWEADLIEVKLLCEQLEAKHNLVESGGMIRGTAAFYRDLAAELTDLGCPVGTPTVAARIWGIVIDRFALSCRNLRQQLDGK